MIDAGNVVDLVTGVTDPVVATLIFVLLIKVRALEARLDDRVDGLGKRFGDRLDALGDRLDALGDRVARVESVFID